MVLSGRRPVGYSQPTNMNYCFSQAAEEWLLLGHIPKPPDDFRNFALFFTGTNQYSLRLVACKTRGAAPRLERRLEERLKDFLGSWSENSFCFRAVMISNN